MSYYGNGINERNAGPDLGFDVISEAYQKDVVKQREAPAKADLTMRQGAPSTYLHAGASKIGWPHDHSVDDTYEVPPFTWVDPKPVGEVSFSEYSAQFGTDGSAHLILHTRKTVGKFDTYADAETAAEALNNHKGY